MRSRRRAARGRRLAADDDRGRLAQELGPQALAEPAGQRRAGTRPGSSHGARSSSVTTTGRPEAIGQRAAADRVIDGARPRRRARPARRPDRRAAQHERVDGHRARAEQPGRRQLAPADDLEVAEPRRSGRRGPTRAGTRTTRRRAASASKAAEQTVRGRSPPAGARSGAWSGRASRTTRTPAGRAGVGAAAQPAAGPVTRVTPSAAARQAAEELLGRGAGRRRRAPRRRSAGSSWTGRRAGRGR